MVARLSAEGRASTSRTSAAVGFLVGATMIVVLVVVALAGRGSTPGDSTAAQGYLEQLETVAKDAGRVVTLGLKAGVTDVGEGRYADELLQSMADGWRQELEALQNELVSMVPPAGFEGAHAGFVSALSEYVQVAVHLEQAASMPLASREQSVRSAIVTGERADGQWDRAAVEVQRRLQVLGIPRVPWLPSQDAASRDGSSSGR